MKTAEKEIITAFLGKTSNLPAETVASLFVKKDDDEELIPGALDILTADHAKTVQANKIENEKRFDNGYKKAQVEVLGKLEKDIVDKFGVTSDKKGLELVEEVVAAKTKVPELEEEKVKAHPAYIKLEKENTKKLKEVEEAFKAKETEREQLQVKEATFKNVTDKASTILKDLKPIFGTADEKKIQAQIEKLLIGDLKQYDFKVEGDEIIVMKGDKRLEDAHGKAVNFDVLIKDNAARNWDFEQGKEHGGSGASNDAAAKAAAAAAAAGKAKYKGTLPKNEAEFNQAFATLQGSENADQRVALMEEYDAQFQQKV